MKNLLTTTALMIVAVSVMAQGAGNYAFTQSKKGAKYDEAGNYDKYNFEYNANQYQYQQPAYASNASDSVYYVTASVLMNVQPCSLRIGMAYQRTSATSRTTADSVASNFHRAICWARVTSRTLHRSAKRS